MANQCCPRDTNRDGNCDRHPAGRHGRSCLCWVCQKRRDDAFDERQNEIARATLAEDYGLQTSAHESSPSDSGPSSDSSSDFGGGDFGGGGASGEF